MLKVTQRWVVIEDFPDYQISDWGNVRSNRTSKTKLLKPRLSDDGYLRVTLTNDMGRKQFTVHTLVARHFIPNPLGKPTVDHKNRIRHICHYLNLRWATYAEQRDNTVANHVIRQAVSNNNNRL